MASARDLKNTSDPSDWRGELSFLRELDESLRCELCYEIFEAPVSFKSCGHSFCSRCIRQHINQPGAAGQFCPKCRQKKAYDSELMPQPALESAAIAWKSSRAALTNVMTKRTEQEVSLEKRIEKLTRQLDHRSARASTSAGVSSLASEDRVSRKQREKRKADSALDLPQERDASSRGRRESNERCADEGEAEYGSFEASPSTRNIEEDDDSTGAGSRSKRSLRTRKAIKLDDGRRSVYQEIPPTYNEGADGASSDGFEIVEEEVKEQPPAKLEAQSEVTCPICNWSFSLVALNRHLDKGTCDPTGPEPSLAERGLEDKHAQGAATMTGNGRLSTKEKNKNPQMWFTRPEKPPGPSSSAGLQHKASSNQVQVNGVGASSSVGRNWSIIEAQGQPHQSKASLSANALGRSRDTAESPIPRHTPTSFQPSRPEPKRLIRPHYFSKKEKDLKSLLLEHGLSTVGTKEKLIERHSQWLNLYNGNLDASEANRKNVSQLKKELELWEGTQSSSAAGVSRGGTGGGGSNPNKASVTDKISERQLNSWIRDHREHFTELTKMAIRAALKNRTAKSVQSTAANADLPAEKTRISSEELERWADADVNETRHKKGNDMQPADIPQSATEQQMEPIAFFD